MKPKIFVAAWLAVAALPWGAIGQDKPEPTPDEVIRKFAQKEKEFRQARANYTYRQDVRVQELDANDRVAGEYHVTSDILFDDKGRRTEKIVYAPKVTLQRIVMSPQDLQDIQTIQPFVLTSDDIAKYNVKPAGREKIDEIDCYVFEVGPKVMEKGQRYFEGKIWVDDQDFQIVKTYGKAVPDIREKGQENLFPRFETYREQIDDIYWFPTYTRAVDTLQFSTGPVRMRQVIKYENYKKFEADVKLTFGDVVDDNKATGDKPQPATAPGGKGKDEKPKEDPKKKKK